MVEKAVILAAGRASRMQRNIQHYVQDKSELGAIKIGEKMAARFRRKPFLDYQVLNLIEAGIREVNLVIRPDDTFFSGHYAANGSALFPEADITFSFQSVPDGTAHAVLAAEKFVEEERFLVLNGDNNYPVDSVRMLVESEEEHSAMVGFDTEGFSEEMKDRADAFAVISTESGRLKKIVEKPANPEEWRTCDLLYSSGNRRVRVTNRNLASMNLWCFHRDIIDACRGVPRHESRKRGKKGEYELTDAVELMIGKRRQMIVYYACTDVLDLTRAEDIEIVDRQMGTDHNNSVTELERRYSHLQ
jgi:dTDP-glucose pyrophosphorylase